MPDLRTITNNYTDTSLLNMDPEAKAHGPFLITQTGIAPGDQQMQDRFWVLRRDGKWVDINFYFATGKLDSLDEALFDTPSEAMTALEKLSGNAEVADLAIDYHALKLAMGGSFEINPGLPRVHAWIARYKTEKKNHSGY